MKLAQRRVSSHASAGMDIEPQRLRLAQDARGIVYEPVTADELPGQRNAHVVYTRPGGIRGNHYHEHGTEIMSVMGPALVRIKSPAGIGDYPVAAGEVARFTIPPKIAHAILNTGTETGVIVSFNSWPHDPARPDVVREVLIEPGWLP
jgi:dTDP-4-dehydrorhamnose 3,5-epimerase-like enzyme